VVLPTEISGIVTKYKGNGRKLGYPTANLNVATDLKDGVYFGYADLADYKNQPALIFVGVPTTVGDTDHRIEVHLLDIDDRDYYGLEIKTRIEHFHRSNQKFASVDELLLVMKNDEAQARAWFSSDSART
jgi:riboflavin kinase/FMN adenylyltransferase